MEVVSGGHGRVHESKSKRRERGPRSWPAKLSKTVHLLSRSRQTALLDTFAESQLSDIYSIRQYRDYSWTVSGSGVRIFLSRQTPDLPEAPDATRGLL